MRAPLRLTWPEGWVPHALLDLLRGCNIECRACYNEAPMRLKSVSEVEEDLEVLLRLRRLDSVSFLGGEVLLHPQLGEIIRAVRRRDVKVELFTNGVLLDGAAADLLAASGADSVFLHIEAGQRRPDLAQDASLAERTALIEEKAALLASRGITPALSFTAFREDLDRLPEILEFAMRSPTLEYVLVTLYRDLASLGEIRGNLREGLRGKPAEPRVVPGEETLTLGEISALMEERFQLHPFAVLPSNRGDGDPRWLTFLVGSAGTTGSPEVVRGIETSRFEPAYVALHRRFARRFPFSQRNRPLLGRLHLLLNAVAGGNARGNLALLKKGTGKGRSLKLMRIVFQCPAELGGDGRVTHCLDCPDAVVVGGELVPVCLCDQVVS